MPATLIETCLYSNAPSRTSSWKSMREKVMETVRGQFKPEFLNRVDEIIVFQRLTRDQISEIVDIQLRSLRDRLAQRGLVLEVRDEALLYRQVSMSVAGVVVPSFMSPRVAARVSAAVQGWHVDVEVEWRQHPVCRYKGVVRAA